jgi:hypothetical protein
MRMPNFSAEASLCYGSGRAIHNGRFPVKWPEKSFVEPAIPRQPNGNGDGEPPVITCGACSSNGFKTCTNHETGQKTTQSCTSCGACAVSTDITNPAALGQFLRTCTTGGRATTSGCTFTKDFPISTPWPLPDICLRLSMSSLLNPNSWNIAQC